MFFQVFIINIFTYLLKPFTCKNVKNTVKIITSNTSLWSHLST